MSRKREKAYAQLAAEAAEERVNAAVSRVRESLLATLELGVDAVALAGVAAGLTRSDAEEMVWDALKGATQDWLDTQTPGRP